MISILIEVKKGFSSAIAILIMVCLVYPSVEPLIIKAASANDSIVVTQAVSSEITITSPSDVTMSSAIPGITGNPGSPRTGSATWTVKTNNATGFVMALKSSTNPSMQLDGTYNFADYSPAAAGVPDYSWASPAASAAEFGYTVEPETAADTSTKFKDLTSACNNAGGGNTADKCWYNMGTTDETVVSRSTNTDDTGEAEVVKFQTESNAKYLKEGNYTATITATVTEN